MRGSVADPVGFDEVRSNPPFLVRWRPFTISTEQLVTGLSRKTVCEFQVSVVLCLFKPVLFLFSKLKSLNNKSVVFKDDPEKVGVFFQNVLFAS